jgi:RimJ/RimL family protein N-acetyltransferase
VTRVVDGDGLRLRPATAEDVDFLVELEADEDVEPFLEAGTARTRDQLVAEIDRQREAPSELGRLVIEVEQDGDWRRAGAMSFQIANRTSRIASLGRLAIHPEFRGRHLSDDAARLLQRYLIYDLDYHRLELQIYGFNERAQRHAERSGFIREGVKRKAYRYGDAWVDAVLYGLVREDLDAEPRALGERSSP